MNLIRFAPLALLVPTTAFAQDVATDEKPVEVSLELDVGPQLGAKLPQRTPVDTFEIGGMYARGRSNDPAKSFDRGFFVPSLTLIKTFGGGSK